MKLDTLFMLLIFGNKYLKSKKGKRELRKWSKEVRRKQPFCDICNTKEKLQAHHLLDKSTAPIFAFTKANGITLCLKHHTEFHTDYLSGFKTPCTPFDYLIYRKGKKRGKKLNILLVLAGLLILLNRKK